MMLSSSQFSNLQKREQFHPREWQDSMGWCLPSVGNSEHVGKSDLAFSHSKAILVLLYSVLAVDF